MSILLTLTTISSRIEKVSLVIESLLKNRVPKAQEDKIDILLYISNSPFLVDKGISYIPDSLERLVLETNCSGSPYRISVNYVPNCGPHRKYIFNKVYDEDVFITIDDDTIYPIDFVEKMVAAVNQYNCVVAMRGRKIVFSDFYIDGYQEWNKSVLSGEPSMLNVGTGKDGIAYKPQFLHLNVWNVDNALKYAAKADDLWLKAHSLLQSVPTVILNSDLKDEFAEIGDPLSKVSLYNSYNQRGGNDFAMQQIDDYLMSNYQTTFLQLIRS